MRAVLTLICLLASAGILGHGATPRTMASNPCQSIMGDPPISDPVELVAGGIFDAGDNYAGVSGASVSAYLCVSGVGLQVSSTETEEDGSYSFELAGGHYYYVQAALTGPLSGMSPSGTTANPTAAIAVGDSVSNVNLAFE